ncbi:peritrophin-44-like [Wyeomyia smithii]|uniref:peritrophin-44-like n=1 Tax=Wyeomyia smithii TaxID=174621 RepID=UPI002467CE2C|nr:peritrophin-44-like [Wyeomyia smithii]
MSVVKSCLLASFVIAVVAGFPRGASSNYNNLCHNVVSGIREHPVNCDRYIECTKFEASEITCPEGQIFSADLIGCVDGDSATCLMKPACGEGYYGRMACPGYCAKYYICTNGDVRLESCLEGYIYYEPFEVCLPGYEDHGECKLYSVNEV